MTENSKIVECMKCGFETECEDVSDCAPPNFPKPVYMCKLCNSTYAGNSFFYPRQYQNEGAILATTVYLFNLLFKRLDELEDQIKELKKEVFQDLRGEQ